jgi:hypothetical protein
VKKQKRLVDYLFVDDALLRRYTEQIRDRFAQDEDRSWSMSASLTGPKLESARKTQRRELNSYERADLLQVYLQVTDDLATKRPDSIDQYQAPSSARFVLETIEATKVIIPAPHLEAVKGLSSFAVWIADPDPAVYSQEPWVWLGTFLYLTEMHWDTLGFQTVFSGCSALRTIVNAAGGQDLLALDDAETFEPFGRGSYEHPIQKLQRIGATVSDRRKITTLYRKRYMTNEQCYTVGEQERRVNDLLAYPVFIAAAE